MAVGVVAVVGLSTAAYVTQNDPGSCVVPPTLKDRGTRLANSVGNGINMFTQPVAPEQVKDVTLGSWHTLGGWVHAFTGAANGKPTAVAPSTPCPTGLACTTGATAAAARTQTGVQPASLSSGSSRFTPEQINIAQTAKSVAAHRGLPQQALIVILATGFQESGISNLDHGDRDSLGWLQQRAGWGSAAQRQDPAYAAGKFFDALVKVDGWEQMPVTRAAQAVQISGYPDAYAKWEDDAKALAASLGNDLPDAPTTPQDCTVDGTITTWNARFDNTDTAVISGIKELGQTASTISVQEFGNETWQRQSLAALGSGWSLSHGETGTGIFYSSEYTKVSESVVPAFGVVHVEDGASGTTVGPRSFNILTLSKGGQPFTIINSHMMPDWQGKRQRTAILGNDIDHLVQLQQQYRAQGPVLLTGDWNASIGDKMLQPLVNAGCVATGSTLGVKATVGQHASYDQVYACGATPSAQMLFGAHGSDHRGYGAVFTGPATASGGGPVPAEFNSQGNPRTVDAALAWYAQHMPNGNGVPVQGKCERWVTLAYGWPGGYPTAIAHWNAPGPRSAGTDVPPRGALVFWRTGNPAGHVAISTGNGMVISTDYNSRTHRYQAGMVSEGPISDIDRWAVDGKRLGWRAPNFKVDSSGGVRT